MSRHTQICYHLVFSTKDRQPTLRADRREDLFRYIWGILKGQGISSTNGTCCEGGRSPAPSEPMRFFRFLSVGCTHGYSRFAASGQPTRE